MNAATRWLFVRLLSARCFENGAETATGTTVQDPPTEQQTHTGGQEIKTEDSGDDGLPDIEHYCGSKELNPEQRPLKPFNRKGLTEAMIDDMIRVAGPELFMTDEEIAEHGKRMKEQDEKSEQNKTQKDTKAKKQHPSTTNDKPKPKADEEKPNVDEDKPKPTADVEQRQDDDEKDVRAFYDATGHTQDTFNALPEEKRKTIVEQYEKQLAEIATIKAENEKLKKTLDEFSADSVISARAKELLTGEKIIARNLPPLTSADINDELLSKLDETLQAGTREEARQILINNLNPLLKERSAELIRRERAIAEEMAETKRLREEVWQELMKVDKLSGGKLNITPADFKRKPDPNSELGKMLAYFDARKWSLKTLKEMGHEEIYAAYGARAGWNKERDKNIEQNVKRTLLEKLSNPKLATSSIPFGRSSAPPKRQTGVEGTLEDLEAGLAEGRPEAIKQLAALNSANEGNPDMLLRLAKIQERAAAKRRAVGRE